MGDAAQQMRRKTILPMLKIYSKFFIFLRFIQAIGEFQQKWRFSGPKGQIKAVSALL